MAAASKVKPTHRKLWTKASDLFAKVGMPQMVAKVQGLFDDLPDAGEDRS